MNGRAFINKRDIWLLGGILLSAAVLYGVFYFLNANGGTVKARITYEGRFAREVDLSRDTVFTLDESPGVRFEVRRGAIAFIESDCPDKICINEGFLHLPGQTAACLPNRVLLSVEKAKSEKEEIDIIAK